MKRSIVIALLPIVFLLFGCASNKIEQRLIALEQHVKNTDTKRDQEIEKINRALDEIKEEQAHMRAMVAENEIRISQLEPSTTSKRAQEKQREGAVTFVKESTVFISLGKNDGVSLGDIFEVYTARKSEEKIASIKITAVSLESSSGEIENKTQDVNIGYFVKIAQ